MVRFRPLAGNIFVSNLRLVLGGLVSSWSLLLGGFVSSWSLLLGGLVSNLRAIRTHCRSDFVFGIAAFLWGHRSLAIRTHCRSDFVFGIAAFLIANGP